MSRSKQEIAKQRSEISTRELQDFKKEIKSMSDKDLSSKWRILDSRAWECMGRIEIEENTHASLQDKITAIREEIDLREKLNPAGIADSSLLVSQEETYEVIQKEYRLVCEKRKKVKCNSGDFFDVDFSPKKLRGRIIIVESCRKVENE